MPPPPSGALAISISGRPRGMASNLITDVGYKGQPLDCFNRCPGAVNPSMRNGAWPPPYPASIVAPSTGSWPRNRPRW